MDLNQNIKISTPKELDNIMQQQQQFLCKLHKKQNLFKCSCEQNFICTTCFDSGKHINHKDEEKGEQGQVFEVKGDLLNFQADIIVQQCNCITTNEKGLSQSILKKFGVSAYETRVKGKGNIADVSSIDIPGTCLFQKPKIKNKNCQIQYIANLFSQFTPGKNGFKYQNTLCQQIQDPLTNKPIVDNFSSREKWFEVCLQQLADFAKEKQLFKIAFPYKIGCGLAGGKWENYKKMIQEFSENNIDLKIYIVQLEE
ncbi:hypothetical protein TTHERM_00237510 (macronuclear) [Tetrahymena thermophila SB210]|uniref:Macro domain-containing protein n=1 Tax=Tetrahymena thermophila (strain SB210) TaxID=312017 RepID=I7LXF4_TETTS|nr:hypothetical protein TTHERM_00237510 [Tetrahymena thermophila SB210]EAS04536.2 hypothetical protein TTHERM_00237510 [Tetrahymena thermophila SB210]|eukprot:XP_001024781.2 hypothetical protein TTHERM_00237510 [Tetrahymena thermophila SB210]